MSALPLKADMLSRNRCLLSANSRHRPSTWPAELAAKQCEMEAKKQAGVLDTPTIYFLESID